ncbi:MAG: zinc metallopeptidase [Clostridiales bacterium]|nr:zinc metallopeptidase [Clostridiales bacterium]
MPFFYNDPTYLLVLAALGLSLIAQGLVKSAYKKYEKVPTRRGMPASRVAMELLAQNGNNIVSVQQTPGSLTDHYDPRNETLSLSQGVYNSSSVAAIGIAAHEAGHAMQKKDGYAPMALRGFLVPVVNIGSQLSFPMILLGLILSIEPLVTVGIVLFSLAVAFSLLTLPVELNASSRAVSMLTAGGFIDAQEKAGVKAVLRAAAFTYVAAALGAVLQLVRLILISQNNRRRN